jgi:hypothetical protein
MGLEGKDSVKEESVKSSNRALLTKLMHLSRLVFFLSLPLATHIGYGVYWERFLEFARDWYSYYPALSPLPYPAFSVYSAVTAVVIELVLLRKIWQNIGTAYVWTLGLITFEAGLVLLAPGYFLGNALLLFGVAFVIFSSAEVILIVVSGFRTNSDVKRRYSGFRSSYDSTIVTIAVFMKTVIVSSITAYLLIFHYHHWGIINEFALVFVAVDILALLAIFTKKSWAYETLLISVSNSYVVFFFSIVSVVSLLIPILGSFAAFILFRRRAAFTSLSGTNLV